MEKDEAHKLVNNHRFYLVSNRMIDDYYVGHLDDDKFLVELLTTARQTKDYD